MKFKIWLYIVLGVILTLFIGSSLYIDFIAESSNGLTYLLIGQIFVGIVGALITLFLGLKTFENKKSYELLFIAYLELLFVLGLVIVNYVYGYGNLIDRSNYIEYMGYISMEFNIYIYVLFVSVIGLLNLNLYLKEKLCNNKEIIEEKQEGLE